MSLLFQKYYLHITILHMTTRVDIMSGQDFPHPNENLSSYPVPVVGYNFSVFTFNKYCVGNMITSVNNKRNRKKIIIRDPIFIDNKID